jgi:hypothetical protein
MGVRETLAWVLARTNASVWWMQKDEDASLPAIVYQIINDDLLDRNQNSLGTLQTTNVQLTLVSNSDTGLQSLITAVKNELDLNTTDFLFTRSGFEREIKEAEDIYVCFKEYVLQWRRT